MFYYFSMVLFAVVLTKNACYCDGSDHNNIATTTEMYSKESETNIDLEDELEFETTEFLTILKKFELDLKNIRIMLAQMENLFAEHTILIQGNSLKLNLV
jgi:hypothetical protein